MTDPPFAVATSTDAELADRMEALGRSDAAGSRDFPEDRMYM